MLFSYVLCLGLLFLGGCFLSRSLLNRCLFGRRFLGSGLIHGVGPSTASEALNNPACLYSVYYQGQIIGMNALMAGEELTIEERDVIEPLEHRRWNAYMRAEGYVYSGSEAEESRNDLGKMHNDLVNFSNLSEEERRKDSKVGTA